MTIFTYSLKNVKSTLGSTPSIYRTGLCGFFLVLGFALVRGAKCCKYRRSCLFICHKKYVSLVIPFTVYVCMNGVCDTNFGQHAFFPTFPALVLLFYFGVVVVVVVVVLLVRSTISTSSAMFFANREETRNLTKYLALDVTFGPLGFCGLENCRSGRHTNSHFPKPYQTTDFPFIKDCSSSCVCVCVLGGTRNPKNNKQLKKHKEHPNV